MDPEWQARIEARGYLAWRHQSFLWENEGYGSFEGYLARFDKNQRRNIRRELQAVEAQGVRLELATGGEITREALERMVGFYESTNDQFGPWAARYLTPRFLPSLYEGFRHRILLASAIREGEKEPVGMSFLLHQGRGAVRALLGQPRAGGLPALRGLLLRADPLGHRARGAALRPGHRLGAQAAPRLPGRGQPQPAPLRRPAAARGHGAAHRRDQPPGAGRDRSLEPGGAVRGRPCRGGAGPATGPGGGPPP